MNALFPGFEDRAFQVSHDNADSLSLRVRMGGTGPALLLVHGYPQTGAMWHPVATRLATDFTVICPDLRGYGASDKPEGGGDHRMYSKRAMAADLAALMSLLGHHSFSVAGHDRGARVVHRLCLDYPDRVMRAAVLDIIPTTTLYETATHSVSQAYFHWYFLTQKAPFPERLIAGDPIFFFKNVTGSLGGAGKDPFHPSARAEYENAFQDPATIHATCEDYRAGATIDLVDDRGTADQLIQCPIKILWGTKAPMHAYYDVFETWRNRAVQPEGAPVEAGHFLVEEAPEAVLPILQDWFKP